MGKYIAVFGGIVLLLWFKQADLFSSAPGNRLSEEKSPYLFQHRNHPVWWYPWGDEAFHRAKGENKPVFLSIGYSTCHWCHVMARESFADEEVAQILNENFVSVKVDREERPDIDAIYMTSLQVLSGRGGWPMTVFLLPDGKPFYAGTYFPKEKLITLLQQIAKVWKEQPERIFDDSQRLTEALTESVRIESAKSSHPPSSRALQSMYRRLESSFDSQFGGFGGAPKFPQTMSLRALMRIHRRLPDSAAEVWIRKTLDAMAQGGIYDHLMGGFHRYSVDRYWVVPHFEKMLYDQALLVTTYLEAYQLFMDDEYLYVAEDILNYVLSSMVSKEGGFYSAEDADSLDPSREHKEEGFFAVWPFDQLKAELNQQEFEKMNSVFELTPSGNFEDKNILVLKKSPSEKKELDSIFSKLRKIRLARPQPHLDDKIIAAWNGWMISALNKAFQITGKQKYLIAAEKAISFHKKWFYRDGKMYRRYRESEVKFTAYADDHASMIAAYLDLYQSTMNKDYLVSAEKLQADLDLRYWDSKAHGYFNDDGTDSSLLLRVKNDHDGVRPSANSLTVLNLVRMHGLTYKVQYLKRADEILNLFAEKLVETPESLAQMLIGLDARLDRFKEVAIIFGNNEQLHDYRGKLYKNFTPNWVLGSRGVPLAEGKKAIDGKTTFYVCENKTCQLPTTNIENALNQIGTTNKMSLTHR